MISPLGRAGRHPAIRTALVIVALGLATGTVRADDTTKPPADPNSKLADRSSPLGWRDARHLLVRTGFGSTPEELETYAALERDAAITRVLDGVATPRSQTPPPWYTPDGPLERPDRSSPEARKKIQKTRRDRASDLDDYWIAEMLVTPTPLAERMTLFWHGHFTSSVRKSKSPSLLLQQNELYRQHAIGNFRTLLHRVAEDPAMLIYLDTVRSSKRAPNENFARELFELFTLGEGQYTERDIKEAARAFTGWRVNSKTRSMRFARRQHDRSQKTIFGRTARFDGHQVLDLVLERPRAARHIVEKLWQEFVSPTPDAAEVERIAALFRSSDYSIRTALEALLKSDAFWSKENRGTLVNGPVDFVVGTIRTFDIVCWDSADAAAWCRTLGQNVFDPPNVAGWPGGARWIHTASLGERERFLAGIRSGELTHPRRLGPVDPTAALATAFTDWRSGLPDAARDLSWLPCRTLPRDEDTAPLDALADLLNRPLYQVR